MRVVISLLAILALSAFIGCQAKPMVVSESGSESEGIKISGNWTVEVRNPDGSLATRKQFTNAILGQHIVAALLSHDLEIARGMQWWIKEDTSGGIFSETAECKEFSDIQNSNESVLTWAKGSNKNVLATAVHAPNANGEMDNSVWNSSCTLEIDGDESKFITGVQTHFHTIPIIPIQIDQGYYSSTLSQKKLDEPIEVWDGQVVAATVIFSVD